MEVLLEYFKQVGQRPRDALLLILVFDGETHEKGPFAFLDEDEIADVDHFKDLFDVLLGEVLVLETDVREHARYCVAHEWEVSRLRVPPDPVRCVINQNVELILVHIVLVARMAVVQLRVSLAFRSLHKLVRSGQERDGMNNMCLRRQRCLNSKVAFSQDRLRLRGMQLVRSDVELALVQQEEGSSFCKRAFLVELEGELRCHGTR